MFEQFTSSIARLFSGNGSIAGAGFLVSSRHLLTCAHVVADALGIRRETVDKPSGKVSLDLPLVAAGDTQQRWWYGKRYGVGVGRGVASDNSTSAIEPSRATLGSKLLLLALAPRFSL